MKPLFPIVVAVLVVAAAANAENAKDVKELSKSKEPLVEAEGSEPQARKERCTTCSNSLKSKNELFQALKSLPNAEVHTQESFEGCSSEKGCAGLKVKDGKVIEKFGNLQAFKAAASADNANDFQFQAAGNSVFDAGVANGGPYWWMNQQNSPFKNGAAAGGGGSFEKFSKSSSSFTSSSGGAGGLDLAANPFLNGDFAKLGGGLNGASNFGSQSEIDITKNQFLNGQSGFGSQSGSAFGSGSQGSFGANAQGFGSNSQSGFGASGQGVALSQGSQGSQGSAGFGSAQSGFNSFNAAGKFGSGYTGSSPAPFTPTGSNVNLIQNSQKNDYDYNQQTQQNIDEVFQSTGNVQAHDNSGGELQQTCAGQGYVCVLKSQCNNGVVNTNGGGLLQANTQKQYCNTRTEICCRIETASLAGAGSLQGSLGVGSATYSGNSQGSGLFSQSGSSQSNQNTQNGFGTSGFGSSQGSTTGFSGVNRGSSGFGSNQFGGSSFGTNKFASTTGSGFGSTVAPSRNFNNEVFKSTSQSNFVETDSFSSGSDNSGIYRPGSVGTGLKPGIPYLPPVDTSISGSNVVSTAYTPAFVTTPRPFSTPRPVTTPRVFTTPKPTYLPPVSTKAPEYLPPVDGYTASDSFQQPMYYDGELILDETLPGPTRPPVPVNNDVPAGCAAALKCTPIEFCTAEGVISNSTVILSRDQEAYRVPLTDCKDLESGRIGKCCRDPFYTDPWPTNQLGKWVPGVFGGNDGKYVPDSRGSSNNPPGVTVRPPVTGSVILNNFQTTPRPTVTRGPNQITQGFPSTTGTPFVKNQYGSGSYGQGERVTSTQYDQGSFGQGGRGQYEIGGKGTQVQTGGGFGVQTGGGVGVQQGGGFRTQQGGGGAIQTGGGGAIQTGGGGAIQTGGGFRTQQGGGGAIQTGGGGAIQTGGGFRTQQGGGGAIQTGGGGAIQTGGGFRTQQGGGGAIQTGGGGAIQTGGGFRTQQGGGGAIQQGGGGAIQTGGGFGVQQGGGIGVQQGGGIGVQQGGGFRTQQGGGGAIQTGGGFGVQQGGGFGVQQGGGFGVQQGGGFGLQSQQGQAIIRGQGQKLIQGTGEKITQELISGVRRGEGFAVQNGAYGVENEFGESIQRVYLPRYTGSGECGILNPQKPYGNHKDLELDFAEIPWQAMVLLQTNRSLLCGGVITRPDVVITSASCVEGLEAKNVLIKGGEWKLGIDDEPLPFQIVQVKHIIRHPFFKAGVLKYDAAILVLTENLRLAKNIWPICLPSSSDTLDAFYNGAGECIVTGWGKTVLQAHLEGSIIHGLNVSLLNPGECQNKINQEYPHLLEHYDQESCACGQPTNPTNNICRVDIGSALACTTGDNHYVLRGIYSWDSGCQVGNQLAGFYKFDLEWYEWAIGLIESVRFSQYTTTKVIKNKVTSQVSGVKYGGGVKGSSGIKGTVTSGAAAIAGSGFGLGSQSGEYTSQFGATKFGSGSSNFGTGSANFGTGSTKFSESGEFNQAIKGPIQKTFSATYSEKKFFQTEPKYVTYTTKPEIVTFTTKPEYFTYTTKPKIITYTTKPEIVTYTTKPEIITYTTKPKIVTYTTKPEIITYTTKPQIIRYDYQTSGSQTNQQIVPPGLSFNPSFTEVVGSKHIHDAKCKCLENGKK